MPDIKRCSNCYYWDPTQIKSGRYNVLCCLCLKHEQYTDAAQNCDAHSMTQIIRRNKTMITTEELIEKMQQIVNHMEAQESLEEVALQQSLGEVELRRLDREYSRGKKDTYVNLICFLRAN